MTRWVAQTQIQYVSATPYNASWAIEGAKESDHKIHGSVGTRQPAIWISIAVVPGVVYEEPFGGEVNLEGSIRTEFESRGLKVISGNGAQALDYGPEEVVTPSYYSVLLDDGFDGRVFCGMSATSRVGHLQFTYSNPTSQPKGKKRPYILIEATRPSIITSAPTNVTYPPGYIKFSQSQLLEVCGYSTERQDSVITPVSVQTAASQFKWYFCARFNFSSLLSSPSSLSIPRVYGVIQIRTVYPGKQEPSGPTLSAYIFLPESQDAVDVRAGPSSISIEQARANLASEVHDVAVTQAKELTQMGPGSALESTARRLRTEWAELLDRKTMRKRK